MLAGKLNRKITIERATVSQDPGSGEAVETWGPLGPTKISAAALPVSDGERVAAAEVSATITMRFQVRWDSAWSSVNPKDRIVYDGRTFDIWGVKEIGLREGIELTAAARSD